MKFKLNMSHRIQGNKLKKYPFVFRMLQLARHTSEEARANFGPISGPGHPKHQSGNPCANRDQERDGSGNLFVPKLDPPSGFSDAFELSEAECDFDRGHNSQRNVRDFVIAV